MSNPTNLSDIVVTGQRRDNISDPFPQYTLISDYYPSTDATIDPADQMGDVQCSLPTHRKIWNADARAAEAVTDFQTWSGGDNIFEREYGAFLRSNGSGVELGNIRRGDPPVANTTPNVDLDKTGVTPANWMGDIHTHVSTNGMPSAEDWSGFQAWLASAGNVQPPRTDLDHVAMYIVVKAPGTRQGYKIYAYTKNSNPNQLGREVDPLASACS